MLPELRMGFTQPPGIQYMSTVTPGAANVAGALGIAPAGAETDPDHPDAQDFSGSRSRSLHERDTFYSASVT